MKTPVFSNFGLAPNQPLLFSFIFLADHMTMPHLMCSFTLQLWTWACSALVPEAFRFVVSALRWHIHRRCHVENTGFVLVLWFGFTYIFTHTHRPHTGRNKLIHTYKNILTPPFIYSLQLSVLNWYQKIYFILQVHTVFVFQKFLMSRSHISWLDSVRVHSSKETQNIDRNNVNEQKKNTET